MAGPRTDKSGRIQKTNGGGPGGANLAQILTGPQFKAQLAAALPRHVNADRMSRVGLTAVRTVPKLAQCDQISFMSSMMQCAQLGLEPCTPLGHAYLIPFWNKKRGCFEVQVIIGYQGYIDLAMRSGKVTGIYAEAVRDGDRFEYERGLDQKLVHVPSEAADREEQPITHVYAVARVRDAEPIFKVLSSAQIQKRRNRSRASNDGPWKTDYEAMCLKTAVRALWPWLPKSIEMAHADELEGASERGVPITATLDDQQVAQLAKAGVYVPPEDPEGVIDAETGEVTEAGEKADKKGAVIQSGEGEGTPLRFADDDRLASYLDELQAEVAQGANHLGEHLAEVQAEIARRGKS